MADMRDAEGDEPLHQEDSSDDPMSALMDVIDEPKGGPSKKRKTSEPDSSLFYFDVKRTKLSDEALTKQRSPAVLVDRSYQLPAGIWHRIFTFLPPRVLGRLLQANKLFHRFLDPTSRFEVFPHTRTPSTLLKVQDPNMIWRASRLLFQRGMPSPLEGKTEPDMWRLCCFQTCQICGTAADARDHANVDAALRGPGEKGVAPAFPFGIAVCGPCLIANSTKELNLLLSSTVPSFLLPGLPAVFLTPQNHVVLPYSITADMQVTKIFWSGHIESLKAEFEQVKELHPEAAEEWVKGLEARGKKSTTGASRWQKWDQSGGLDRLRASKILEKDSPAKQLETRRAGDGSFTPNHILAGEQQPIPTSNNENRRGMLVPPYPAAAQPRPQGQQKRIKEEVEIIRTTRRAEIERQAAMIEPPLLPNVLAHIPSFQAALQITAPLDYNAWVLLRSRMLSQRSEAEKSEKRALANVKMLTKAGSGSHMPNVPTKMVREVTDEDWNEAQGPVRTCLNQFANEIIRDGWDNGAKVTKKTAARFAPEVLLYVRKRFYTEVAKDDAAIIAAGGSPMIEPQEGPWVHKLTLENLKWTFDTKIKPHTDKFRKEVFTCNGCAGKQHKLYALEGVLQHYAAKHTTAMSNGSVVVHWRSEWPEIPPFGPGLSSSACKQGKNVRDQQPLTDAQQIPSNERQEVVRPTPVKQSQSSVPNGSALPGPFATPPSLTPNVAPTTHRPPQPPPQQYTAQIPGLGIQGGHLPTGSHLGLHSNPSGQYGTVAPASSTWKQKVAFMALKAKQTWNSLSTVKDLPGPVKLATVIHHIAKHYQKEFQNEGAPFEMFKAGIADHKYMRPVRSVNGLRCKACVDGKCRRPDTKTYTLPQLLNHFNKNLVSPGPSQSLDWRTDLVCLPELRVLMRLPNILASNRAAYDAVADALPWAFTSSAELDSSLSRWPQQDDGYSPPPAAPSHAKQSYKEPALPNVYNKGEGYLRAMAEREEQQSYDHAPMYENDRSPSYEPAPAALSATPSQVRPYATRMSIADQPNLRPASAVYDGRELERLRQVELDDARREQLRYAPPHEAYTQARGNYMPRVDEPTTRLDNCQAHYIQDMPVRKQRWTDDHQYLPNAPVSQPFAGYTRVMAQPDHSDQYHHGVRYEALPAEHQSMYLDGSNSSLQQQQRAPQYTDHHPHDSYPQEQFRYVTEPAYREEEYELLEVRDPVHGRYLIKRPLRKEGGYHQPQRYVEYARQPTQVIQREEEYEEYDPRYPSSGKTMVR